jgi:osmotically-inducible protein OsmY
MEGIIMMKTDAQLQADVIAELQWEPAVDAAQIGVEVSGGIVTLAGHVSNYAGKWNAEHAARRVYGVKALVVEIDVTLEGSTRRTDVDIARSATEILQWTTDAPADTVQIKVEKGNITLTGAVDFEYQRRDAAAAIRDISGVKSVINMVTIKTNPSTRVVKADIDAALKRRASRDSNRIKVSVEGGEVTLSGSVHGWIERELANHSAWGAPGVRNVVDQMTIDT